MGVLNEQEESSAPIWSVNHFRNGIEIGIGRALTNGTKPQHSLLGIGIGSGNGTFRAQFFYSIFSETGSPLRNHQKLQSFKK